MSNESGPGRPSLAPGEKQTRVAKAFGVMGVMAIVLGGAGGAFFAWNIRPVIAAGLPLGPFVGGGALLGAIIAFIAFRRMFNQAAKSA